MPVGDDLTIILFFVTLAVTALVTALSLLDLKRRIVVIFLFLLSVCFLAVGVSWPWFKDSFPKLRSPIEQIASSPVSWFSALMFLTAVALTIYRWKVASKQQLTNEPAPSKSEPINSKALFLENIILAAGLTPQTTNPVLLIAKAKIPNDRLRVVLEYSYLHHAIGSAGWTSPRQVQLADLKDIIRGQEVRLHLVSCKLDGSEIGWGGEKDSAGNLIRKSSKYRAQIRFIGSDNEEQTYRFGLIRTSMNEAPYIAEVFTEQDLDMKG